MRATATRLLAVTLAVAGCGPEGPELLTVAGWGGSYGRAVEEGAIIPFTLATGIPVRAEDYNVGSAFPDLWVEAPPNLWQYAPPARDGESTLGWRLAVPRVDRDKGNSARRLSAYRMENTMRAPEEIRASLRPAAHMDTNHGAFGTDCGLGKLGGGGA